MAVYLALIACSLFGGALACEGTNLSAITDALTAAQVDWKDLADRLDVDPGRIEDIATECGNLAKRCRRGLVQAYCDSQVAGIEVLVENIAQALDKMGKKRHADSLRERFRIAGAEKPMAAPVMAEKGTCFSDDLDCSGTATPLFTPPPDEKWREEEPAEDELLLIKYKEADGKEKNYRLLQSIQTKWKDIGRHLGIGSAVLNGYKSQHLGDIEEQCQEVFNHWRNAGAENYPFTWNGVLKILRDVQMGMVAERLEKALSNRV